MARLMKFIWSAAGRREVRREGGWGGWRVPKAHTSVWKAQ